MESSENTHDSVTGESQKDSSIIDQQNNENEGESNVWEK